VARILKEESTLKRIVGGLEVESGILGRIWKYELIGGGVLILIGIVLGILGYGWITAGAGAVATFFGVAHRTKSKDNVADIGRFKGGAAGEGEVTKILQAGLPDSYIILNDISVRSGRKSAQNDHLVLGPNGIFVVETKAYSGTLIGKATDDKLRQVKNFRGKVTETKLKNPIPQNEYHMQIVGERMSVGGFAADDLCSIIVFTNKWTRLEISGSTSAIVKPENLASTILSRVSKYSYDEEWLMRLVKFLYPTLPPQTTSAPS